MTEEFKTELKDYERRLKEIGEHHDESDYTLGYIHGLRKAKKLLKKREQSK